MRPSGASQYLACHDCDTLFAVVRLREGERIDCPTCSANILTAPHNSLHRATALLLAAAVFFFVANIFPFLTLRREFRENEMVLSECVTGLFEEGYPYLAIAVAIFTLVSPTIVIAGMLYLLLPLLRERRLPGALALCRLVSTARRWSMLDVFLLGVLVSLLKLGKLATLSLGTSFWAFVGLIACLTAALASIDFRELWGRVAQAR